MYPSTYEELEDVLAHANDFLGALPERRVGESASGDELRTAFDAPLPEEPMASQDVIRDLIKTADAGLMGTTSPRYFGFVIGGATPTSIAAEWLASVWDQNAALFATSPAASAIEDVAGRWLIELLGLPKDCSFGFVTGSQMANFTALAVARNHVLRAAAWDVERRGLQGAPQVRVIAGAERHGTIDRALRYLGLGDSTIRLVDADNQGRMRAEVLRSVLEEYDGPMIVCAQAGNVDSGSFDPFEDICEMAHEQGAWVHIDGAFGLWANVSDRFHDLTIGAELADSWAVDAHKWLNVPQDSGIVFCAHPESHRAAMGVRANYLIHSEDGSDRDPMEFNPEWSRRARGLAVYAAIRALGRSGIVEIVERCCQNARRFAQGLGSADGVEIVNDVVLNQVLVRFLSHDGDHDTKTRAVIEGVQAEGTCWLGGSTWHGMGVMRISVSNWQTTEEDVDRSVEAMLRVASSV